jgi:hypothetical protein
MLETDSREKESLNRLDNLANGFGGVLDSEKNQGGSKKEDKELDEEIDKYKDIDNQIESINHKLEE